MPGDRRVRLQEGLSLAEGLSPPPPAGLGYPKGCRILERHSC